MTKPAFDYRELSVDERLELVGDIWDSIAAEADANPDLLPLTEDQKLELDRRVAEYEARITACMRAPSIDFPMDA